MNVQFAVQGDDIYVLEANPRASRTAPFVAKAVNIPIAGIAEKLQAGEKLSTFNLKSKKLDHVAVKEAVFPFARFAGVDPILGPEMKSTGEVMGLDKDLSLIHIYAKEVLSGMECGLTIKNFTDYKVGDVVEAYEIEEVKRTL